MPALMLPLIADCPPERTFAWRAGQAVSCGRALACLRALARQLAPHTPCINLCEERFGFALAFAAVGLAGGVNLLPQSRAAEALKSLREDYPDALTLDDARVAALLQNVPDADDEAVCPRLEASRRIAEVFTSGSTGRPSRHAKHWGDLVLGAKLYQRRFFAEGEKPNTVATVPPQHMYGLETTILPMLQLGCAVDTGRPFMPWAVADALTRLPEPRLLVTTPVHLRACFDAGVAMPTLARIISATAPLDAALAGAVEDAWQTRVMEIYGSTETGSVASRRTIADEPWRLYDDMALSQRDGVWLRGRQLPEPFLLSDALDVVDEHSFRLLGRSGDLLKLAGKRMSVNELTCHLRAVEGVQDAVVFRQDDDGPAARPAALVVAAGLGARDIAVRLAQAVDPVFVPRPLLCVEALPRDALGKLPRGELLALFHRLRARTAQP